MNYRFFTILTLLALAAPLCAGQGTAPVLRIKQTPLSSWSTEVIAAEGFSKTQFEIVGDEGGWVHLAIDSHATHQGAPTWVAPPPSTLKVEALGLTAYPEGMTQPAAIHEPLFKFLVENLGFKDLGGAWYLGNVTNWYLPLLAGETSRIWNATPPIWLLSPPREAQTQAYMTQSLAWWQSRTSGFMTGAPTPAEFDIEALFKAGLLMRELSDPSIPLGSTNAYLEAGYATALLTGEVFDVSLTVQPIWLKGEEVGPPTNAPRTAPILDFPPLASLGNPLTIPLKLPAPNPSTVHAQGLIGPVQPGQTKYFALRNAIPPVVLRFLTSEGSVWVPATSSATIENPLRFQVQVPNNVIEGPINVNDARDYTPILVGHVTDVT